MQELSFKSTALNSVLTSALEKEGFVNRSPIQAKVIPLRLKGKNVLGIAPTGTGKTLSYLCPILSDRKDDGHVQAIILSPTVALLSQIKEVASRLLNDRGFSKGAVKAIYDEKDFTKSCPLIVLITPSLYPKVTSHYPVNELKRIVIDEGDRIAFDGFADCLASLSKPKEKGRISFFSASVNEQDVTRVKRAFHILNVVDVRKEITNKSVSHHRIDIRTSSKAEALKCFLDQKKPYKTIAFVSSKEELYKVAEELKNRNVHFLFVHGALDKRVIKQTRDKFRKDEEHLLLASDYVSRGIDIPQVDTIVSVDLPYDLDYYFHRAGRAGRFDAPGDSYFFVSDGDEDGLQKAKDLNKRGLSFDTLILSNGVLRNSRGNYQFKNRGKKDRAENEKLQKKIRHVVNKTKSKKVKPNYKKKVQRAVDLVKLKHRKKVVLTNIIKSGGNATDFHRDDDKPRKRKSK